MYLPWKPHVMCSRKKCESLPMSRIPIILKRKEIKVTWFGLVVLLGSFIGFSFYRLEQPMPHKSDRWKQASRFMEARFGLTRLHLIVSPNTFVRNICKNLRHVHFKRYSRLDALILRIRIYFLLRTMTHVKPKIC